MVRLQEWPTVIRIFQGCGRTVEAVAAAPAEAVAARVEPELPAPQRALLLQELLPQAVLPPELRQPADLEGNEVSAEAAAKAEAAVSEADNAAKAYLPMEFRTRNSSISARGSQM